MAQAVPSLGKTIDHPIFAWPGRCGGHASSARPGCPDEILPRLSAANRQPPPWAERYFLGSHAMATGLFAVALAPVRYFARDRRFALCRWKITILDGCAGAVLVLGVVLLRVIRSSERILPFQTTRHGSRGQP